MQENNIVIFVLKKGLTVYDNALLLSFSNAFNTPVTNSNFDSKKWTDSEEPVQVSECPKGAYGPFR